MPADRVLFLDIDGVLNRHGAPFPPFGWYEPARGVDGQCGLALPTDPTRKLATFLGILEAPLVGRARDLVAGVGAEVVIASGWRKFLPLGLLGDFLAAAGWPQAPIIGATPVLGYSGGGGREAEIRAWIEGHRPHRWAALDDGVVPREGRGIVRVDGSRGLREPDCIEVRKLLNGQVD